MCCVFVLVCLCLFFKSLTVWTSGRWKLPAPCGVLGMWGIHDRALSLRKALHLSLTGPSQPRFQERWRAVMGGEEELSGPLVGLWQEVVAHSNLTPMPSLYQSATVPPTRHKTLLSFIVCVYIVCVSG